MSSTGASATHRITDRGFHGTAEIEHRRVALLPDAGHYISVLRIARGREAKQSVQQRGREFIIVRTTGAMLTFGAKVEVRAGYLSGLLFAKEG
jgi:hypothetical protein